MHQHSNKNIRMASAKILDGLPFISSIKHCYAIVSIIFLFYLPDEEITFNYYL